MNPQTVHDVLLMLAQYHEERATRYQQLEKACADARAEILLGHLVELEQQSARVIRSELNSLPKDQSTYLLSGPTISPAAMHAAECQCDGSPSFDEALACALTSDQRLEELIERIENCSAAGTVAELGKKLRDFESTKSREISKFTRED